MLNDKIPGAINIAAKPQTALLNDKFPGAIIIPSKHETVLWTEFVIGFFC